MRKKNKQLPKSITDLINITGIIKEINKRYENDYLLVYVVSVNYKLNGIDVLQDDITYTLIFTEQIDMLEYENKKRLKLLDEVTIRGFVNSKLTFEIIAINIKE